MGLSSRDQSFHHEIPHMSKYVTFLLGKSSAWKNLLIPCLEKVSILGSTQEGDPGRAPYCPQDYLFSAVSRYSLNLNSLWFIYSGIKPLLSHWSQRGTAVWLHGLGKEASEKEFRLFLLLLTNPLPALRGGWLLPPTV